MVFCAANLPIFGLIYNFCCVSLHFNKTVYFDIMLKKCHFQQFCENQNQHKDAKVPEQFKGRSQTASETQNILVKIQFLY